MHPLIQKKFSKVFDFFDTDRNNLIGKHDYHLMAERFALVRGITLGSHLHTELQESMLLVWSRLCTVLNISEDSMITRDEFIHAEELREDFHRNLKPDEYHDTIAFFYLMDVKEQGFLTVEEYVLALGVATNNITREEVVECFKILDVNGDGQVTLPELIELWGQFFNSTDPSSPGNNLFGRIQ